MTKSNLEKGIGRATAELFHSEGAEVYASDINAETLKTLPSGIHSEVLDVTDSAAVEKYCQKFSKIDVLFNVAGWVPHGSVLDSRSVTQTLFETKTYFWPLCNHSLVRMTGTNVWTST